MQFTEGKYCLRGDKKVPTFSPLLVCYLYNVFGIDACIPIVLSKKCPNEPFLLVSESYKSCLLLNVIRYICNYYLGLRLRRHNYIF